LYNKVNNLAHDKYHHRLFAVIQIGTEQRKVTTEDIICKVDEFHPTIGDRIRFEKVI
jgi:ribosomal protein L21